MVKKHLIGVRMDDDELARVKRVSEHFGLGAQDAIRMIVKEKADEIVSKRLRTQP